MTDGTYVQIRLANVTCTSAGYTPIIDAINVVAGGTTYVQGSVGVYSHGKTGCRTQCYSDFARYFCGYLYLSSPHRAGVRPRRRLIRLLHARAAAASAATTSAAASSPPRRHDARAATTESPSATPRSARRGAAAAADALPAAPAAAAAPPSRPRLRRRLRFGRSVCGLVRE